MDDKFTRIMNARHRNFWNLDRIFLGVWDGYDDVGRWVMGNG